MGLLDSIANGIKESHQKSKDFEQKRLECTKDLSVALTITFGNNELGIAQISTLRQKSNGITYFNFADDVQYRLIGYEWDGPIYEQMTTSNTYGNQASQTVKKGKSGRMAVGAIVGTALLPGVGTAVGAAIGAGGKSKSKTVGNNYSNTQQISKQIEKNSKAIIRLQNINDNVIHSLTIMCNSEIDAKIRCFNFEQNKSTADLSKDMTDSLKGIKALKELLDMGAITQEEFESKKQQLLNS